MCFLKKIYRLGYGLLCCFLIHLPFSHAQTLTDTLKEVQIQSKKNNRSSHDIRIRHFTSGQKTIRIDSNQLKLYRTQNIAQLLSQQTPVFIKSYGLNGLATLNFRGSSAAQSQVYWNGIPIQNAALGIADLSLLPVGFMQDIQVLYGSAAALLGSGNVGGALLLDSETPHFDSNDISYELGLGAGSFAQYQLAGKIKAQHKKWFVAINALAQSSKNNFPYTYQNKNLKTENAQLKGHALQATAAYQINTKNVVSTHVWYQHYNRNIPPAVFENHSLKNRADVSLKIMADWKHSTGQNEQYFRASFIQDEMRYEDPVVQLFTKNISHQYYTEAGWKQTLGRRHKLLLFAPVQILSMQQTDVAVEQIRYGIAAAYNYSSSEEKLQTNINARAEIIDRQAVFLPGINISYQIHPSLQLRGNLQKTYRVPTLNELYFEPGGNPELKPEQGWAADAGYDLKNTLGKRFSITHSTDIFYRAMKDWITWFGGSIWTPHNIAKVRSAGLETGCKLYYKLNSKINAHAGIQGAYTKAATLESHLPGTGSIGKQIPYTPEWMGLANVGLSFRNSYLNIFYHYTGLRYYNIDETGRLEAYTTLHLQLKQEIIVKKHAASLAFQFNNILNENYTVIAARPMPGRNISFSFTIEKK